MFTARLKAPKATDINLINVAYNGKNHALVIDKTTGCVLPNCTGYVHFRTLELCGEELEKRLCLNNAVAYWNYSDGLPRGTTPKEGAIAVWSGGSKGYGHVAIVEQVFANGDINTSNSNYSGTWFYTKRMSPPYSPWNGYSLLGFIYLPTEGNMQPISKNAIRLKMGEASHGDLVTISAKCAELGINCHESGKYIVTDDVVAEDAQIVLATLCNSLSVGCNAYYLPLSADKVRLICGVLGEADKKEIGAVLSSLCIAYYESGDYIITENAISSGDQVLIVAECDKIGVDVAIYSGEPTPKPASDAEEDKQTSEADILTMIDDLRKKAEQLVNVEAENKQLHSDIESLNLTVVKLKKTIDDIKSLAQYE